MNSKFSHMLSIAVLSMIMLAGASFPALGFMHDEAPCVANAMTLQQLSAARQATAGFQNVRAAENAGYTNINLPVPNMGHHWVNWELVDDTFEADKPEALVYADLGRGRLELVAVEYLTPLTDQPPSGFAGTCDRWSPFGNAFWTLHAWIWQPNISGTFAKFNPLIP